MQTLMAHRWLPEVHGSAAAGRILRGTVPGGPEMRWKTRPASNNQLLCARKP